MAPVHQPLGDGETDTPIGSGHERALHFVRPHRRSASPSARRVVGSPVLPSTMRSIRAHTAMILIVER